MSFDEIDTYKKQKDLSFEKARLIGVQIKLLRKQFDKELDQIIKIDYFLKRAGVCGA